jgi:alginate biosynthesis protein AlgK
MQSNSLSKAAVCFISLRLAGCSSVADTERAKWSIENGFQQTGIEQLVHLADKGYNEVSLALGDFYLQQKDENELLKAQQWYSPLLPWSDKSRLGYTRWLAKVSHIDPSVRPLAKNVLMYRQQSSHDVAVELSRFIQNYHPDEVGFIEQLLTEMQDDDSIDPKELLRVIDALFDPLAFQEQLISLCDSTVVDYHFYCIRSNIRLTKLHAIGSFDQHISDSHNAFQNEQISVKQLISIADLLASNNIGDRNPNIALKVIQPWLESSDSVFLVSAKLALRHPDLIPFETLLSRLEKLDEEQVAAASLYLARLYLDGQLVAENPTIAYGYLKNAQSEPEAKYQMGVLILSGELTDIEPQYDAQYAVNSIIEAGREFYLEAYQYLANKFSDPKSYLYNPIYASVFATVYERLGGKLDADEALQISHLKLTKTQQQTVETTVMSELADGVDVWQRIEIDPDDIAYLLGEKTKS